MSGTKHGTTAEIEALAQLLKEEISAIDRGDLDKVVQLYPRKAELLAALEAAAPAIGKSTPSDTAMRERLQELQALVRKDAALLERMTEATSDLVSEISRIRDRHGLKGLYGAKGEMQKTTATVSQRVNQKV